MLSTRILLFLVLATLFVSAGRTAAQVITLTGDIYDGQIGPLNPGIYHCNNIRVPAGKTLTIRNSSDEESLALLELFGFPFRR